MARLKAEILRQALAVVIGVAAALFTSGMRLGAIETRTARNEQDIRELRQEIIRRLDSISEKAEFSQQKLDQLMAEQRILHGMK